MAESSRRLMTGPAVARAVAPLPSACPAPPRAVRKGEVRMRPASGGRPMADPAAGAAGSSTRGSCRKTRHRGESGRVFCCVGTRPSSTAAGDSRRGLVSALVQHRGEPAGGCRCPAHAPRQGPRAVDAAAAPSRSPRCSRPALRTHTAPPTGAGAHRRQVQAPRRSRPPGSRRASTSAQDRPMNRSVPGKALTYHPNGGGIGSERHTGGDQRPSCWPMRHAGQGDRGQPGDRLSLPPRDRTPCTAVAAHPRAATQLAVGAPRTGHPSPAPSGGTQGSAHARPPRPLPDGNPDQRHAPWSRPAGADGHFPIEDLAWPEKRPPAGQGSTASGLAVGGNGHRASFPHRPPRTTARGKK